ncbi:porin [Pseudanabaenaceae cyanobacterium LEGE 13415]|nr:porin [Pseudanabaenaceae cyanobacterium LEGE 13415]
MSDLTRHAMTKLSWLIEVCCASITLLCVNGLQAPSHAQSSTYPSPESATLQALEHQHIAQSQIAQSQIAQSQIAQAAPPDQRSSVSEDAVIRQVSKGIALPATSRTGFPAPEVSTPVAAPSAPQSSPVRFTLPDRLHSPPVATLKATPTVPPPASKPDFSAQIPDSSPTRNPLRTSALTPPSLVFQGVYLYQGDETSARARLTGIYPLSPNAIVGGTVDVTTGRAFSDSPNQGFNVNELYVALSPRELPGLRFVVGQLDLTSYFDRNSFAKDGTTQFFSSVFQTNPALSATGITSRPGALVNLSLGDNLEAKAAVFSSARGLGDFSLDAFAGEVGLRTGNLIVRGTYVTARDAGSNSGFDEIFSFNRGNNEFGLQRGDREEAYGVNAEYFIPAIRLGLFGRYGRYNNVELDRGGDTYSFGLTFLDLFTQNDRLGIAYGQGLSNSTLRRRSDRDNPNVLEVFYDFRVIAGLRLGFSVQSRNDFSETIAGVRLRTEFDVLPRSRTPD